MIFHKKYSVVSKNTTKSGYFIFLLYFVFFFDPTYSDIPILANSTNSSTKLEVITKSLENIQWWNSQPWIIKNGGLFASRRIDSHLCESILDISRYKNSGSVCMSSFWKTVMASKVCRAIDWRIFDNSRVYSIIYGLLIINVM